MDELLTPTGAAHLIITTTRRPCSTDAVRRWADSERIPSTRTSGGVRVRLFKASDVRRFAETLVDRAGRRRA